MGPRWRGDGSGLVDAASVELEVTREGVAWGGVGTGFEWGRAFPRHGCGLQEDNKDSIWAGSGASRPISRQAPAVLASPPAPHLSPPPRPRMWRTLAWTHHPMLRLAPPQIPGSLAREPHRAHPAVELSLWSQRGHGPCCLPTRTHHSPSYPPQAPGGWRLWLEEVSPTPPKSALSETRGED